MLTLRPYQEAGIAAIREAYRSGRNAPLYVLPTGGGKTVCFAAIAHGAAAKGNTVLILTHRIELVDQISVALTHAETPHGYVVAGYSDEPRACMVGSIPTVLRRLGTIARPQLIVIDEAHHVRSKTWTQVVQHWPFARLLGVTATPVRASGEGLGTIFDKLILGPSVAELTAQGYLAPARVFAPPTVDTSGLHTRAGDFVAAEAEALLDKPAIVGSALEHYRRHADGLPAMIFCVSVRHAENVAEQFRDAGYSAMSLDGTTAREVRRGVVSDFRAGRIQVLTSCDLVSEGFDLPGVHVGMLLRPTRSLGLYAQQIGRVLRPAPGKTHALIFDHVGNTQRFGLPDESRHWTLTDQDRERKPVTPGVKICPKCFAAMRAQARACPECGHVLAGEPRVIAEVAGSLAEITAETLAKRAARRDQGKAQSLEQLLVIERQRGYRRGWAQHVFAARQRRA